VASNLRSFGKSAKMNFNITIRVKSWKENSKELIVFFWLLNRNRKIIVH